MMKAIKGYKIEKLLTKGGMASIYLAEQVSLKRQVILKLLNPELDKSIKKQFIEEGRIIASLKHPNIITVFDVVSNEQYNFLSMEYLPAGDLKRRLSKKLDLYFALQVISKIADALHCIHKQGIIHGDIKPENILFRSNDCPLLTDFGISHKAEPKQEMELSGQSLYASPSYASPELVQGKPFDYRTDLYSLGIMMYELIVGKKPFVGDSDLEIIANSIQQSIPKLPAQLSELQPLLESLLAKTPDERLSDAKLVTRFIDQYLKEQSHLKEVSHETKLIDTDVVVEYIAKKNSSYPLFNKIFLFISLLTILFVVLFNFNQAFISLFKTKTDPIIKTALNKKNTTSELKQRHQKIINPQVLTSNFEVSDNETLLKAFSKNNDNAKQQEKAREEQRLKKQQIADLLLKGNASLKQMKLTIPKKESALFFFNKVLLLDASNSKAQQGIDKIVSQYEQLARAEMGKYHYKKSQYYINKGLSIEPRNKDLLALKNKANLKSEPRRVVNKIKNFFINL